MAFSRSEFQTTQTERHINKFEHREELTDQTNRFINTRYGETDSDKTIRFENWRQKKYTSLQVTGNFHTFRKDTGTSIYVKILPFNNTRAHNT